MSTVDGGDAAGNAVTAPSRRTSGVVVCMAGSRYGHAMLLKRMIDNSIHLTRQDARLLFSAALSQEQHDITTPHAVLAV